MSVVCTEGCTYAAKVWALCLVQGAFSVAPCQTLIVRFATNASPHSGGRTSLTRHLLCAPCPLNLSHTPPALPLPLNALSPLPSRLTGTCVRTDTRPGGAAGGRDRVRQDHAGAAVPRGPLLGAVQALPRDVHAAACDQRAHGGGACGGGARRAPAGPNRGLPGEIRNRGTPLQPMQKLALWVSQSVL
jgi:hypothetical protein